MKLGPALIAAAIVLPSSLAWAQGAPFPSKVIRVINPVAPGGNQDIVARAYAEQLSREFGQPVVVESRPGSSAMIGTRYVKNSPPDGYTLLAISNTFARVPALKADAGYDPIKDFAAISQTCDVPLVLVVNPALPVKNVQELIALAKRRPGELTSAASGVGSTGQVATAVFSRQAGIKMMDVQYKGAAPAVVDLVGGHVMVRFDQVTTSLPLVRSGRLRALAVTTATRSSVLPDVPTMQEAGLAGYHDSTFNGYVAPAGTPREVIDRLRAEIAKAAAIPELHERFKEQGIDLIASKSSQEFADFLQKEVSEFAVLARQAGLTVN